jgi:hypothetical protein
MSRRRTRAAVTVLVAAAAASAGAGAVIRTVARPARRVDLYDVAFDLAPGEAAPAELAATVRRRFADLSPVPADEPVTRVGQIIVLRFAGIAPMPVVVREMDSRGWVFGTRRGHPAHPARIRFAFEGDRRDRRLRVSATGIRRRWRRTDAPNPVDAVLTGTARALWGVLAAAIDEAVDVAAQRGSTTP